MEIHTIQPFLQYFDNVRERTMRVARCVPKDKIDWSYAPGKFSLGDLLRHIAVAERYLFAENIQGHPSRYTTHRGQIYLYLGRLGVPTPPLYGRTSEEVRARSKS